MQSYRAQEKPIDDRILVTRRETSPETSSQTDSGPDTNSRHTPSITAPESPGAWMLRAALLAHDPDECRCQAERAGANQDNSAVAPLTTLLQPPRGLRMRVKRKRWAQARLSAVHALEQIGTKATLPPLARALLDPSPLVQSAAAHALERVGPPATAAVTTTLYDAGDWPLGGMKRLVETLGQLQTPQANAALVPLILGSQPAAPKRWDALFDASRRAAILTVIVSAIAGAIKSGMILAGLGTGILVGIAVFIVWGAFVITCVLPVRVAGELAQRSALATLAAEELLRQKDITHLPALIEGAFGSVGPLNYKAGAVDYKRVRTAPARRAVLHLLPLVTEDDAPRFSSATRQRLMEALGRNYDNDMDMALLRVLEWMGDGQVIPRVERIAGRGATEELRAEAARILPVLQERQRQAQAPAMLLRPSQAQAAHPEQLLRPGCATDTTPAVQLLRPTQGE